MSNISKGLATATTSGLVSPDGNVVNAHISASAAIAGSKLVAATDAVAGAVTTGAQNIAGVKTFYDGVKLDDNASAGGRTTLAYYAEADTSGVTLQWDGSSPGAAQTFTVKMTRIGRQVTLLIPAVLATTGTGASSTQADTTAIDSWARPASTLTFRVLLLESTSTRTDGLLQINSGGVISISKFSAAAWNSSASCGTTATSITYTV